MDVGTVGEVISGDKFDSSRRGHLGEFIIVPQTPSDGPSPGHFPTTRWSRVILAGDPDAPLARESLAELCDAYWYPLYAYIRRRGHGPEQARDLTQDFFARALEKGLLAEADPARGRFRSFLRTVCATSSPTAATGSRPGSAGAAGPSCRSTRPTPRGGTRASWPTG